MFLTTKNYHIIKTSKTCYLTFIEQQKTF